MITGAHAIVFAQDAEAARACDGIEATVAELEAKGVEFVAPISDEGFGRMTRLRVPGGGEPGLYQPTHPSPLNSE